MRKIIVLILISAFVFPVYGCKKQNPYIGNISELRQDVYAGNANGLTLTAAYGFREDPFLNDGKVGETIYGYTFKLNVIADEIRRTVETEINGKTFSAVFKYDDITGEYKAWIETETHFIKEFTVNLICGTETVPVVLSSKIPENCLNYESALDIITVKQQSLFNSYNVNGKFSAELYMRVFIKNEKPYWYVGIASGNGKLKAFLTDGYSGELLAVRDIM